MKTTRRCILVLLVMLALTTSCVVIAASHNPSTLSKNINAIEVSQLGRYCFIIFYNGDDLNRKKDIAMLMDIEWTTRENVPYYILENEFIEIEYHSPKDSPATLACLLYREPLVTLYF